MKPGRRRTVIWVSGVGLLVLLIGFWSASGPPGVVDLIGYEEIEPGVVEVALRCHTEVEGHFKMNFENTMVIFATGSDPDRFSFGRDDCLSNGESTSVNRLAGVDSLTVSTSRQFGPLP